jgi:hypothetical protein
MLMKRLVIVLFASALVVAAQASGMPGPSSSSVTIAASAHRIVFGSSTLITGQVTGKKAAGASVQLQGEPFPYKSFSMVASTTADATGHYSFKVTPGLNTIYRATAKAAPSATSSNLLVQVRVRVTLRVATTTPAVGQRVRFSGSVLPAYNGKTVLIQRKTATGWRTIAQARLVAAQSLGSFTRSKYGRRIRLHRRGIYRVWFNPGDNARLPNSSPNRRLT